MVCLCLREKYEIALPFNMALNLEETSTSGSRTYKCKDIDFPKMLVSHLYILPEDYSISLI